MDMGLYQRSSLSPFLFAIMMDRLTGDIEICSESREQVEENLESGGRHWIQEE